MLRTVANEMGDEAIELSSSETGSEEDDDSTRMNVPVHQDMVDPHYVARKEVNSLLLTSHLDLATSHLIICRIFL